jgi:hypothetical protein
MMDKLMPHRINLCEEKKSTYYQQKDAGPEALPGEARLICLFGSSWVADLL